MQIHLTGALKDLLNSGEITLKYCHNAGSLKEEINGLVPDIQKISYRVSVNGRIAENQSVINEGDRVELITLLQGG